MEHSISGGFYFLLIIFLEYFTFALNLQHLFCSIL